jgi:hypothetical protein
VTTFNEIVSRKPDFAEGWNKRATIFFLLGQYEKSLAERSRSTRTWTGQRR